MKGVRESRTLTQDELQRFLTAVKTFSPNRYAEIILLAMTGMRPGEVYALKWDSVDCDRELFIVQRGISGRELTDTTKTKVPREVPMHPILAEVLREHRQHLIRTQHPGLATNFVFPSDNGKMRLSGSTEKVYKNGREAAKLEVKVGHQVLRRTLNTLMTREGVDRITQRAIIGHSSEKMTQLYTNVDMADKKGAILKVFGGEGEGED